MINLRNNKRIHLKKIVRRVPYIQKNLLTPWNACFSMKSYKWLKMFKRKKKKLMIAQKLLRKLHLPHTFVCITKATVSIYGIKMKKIFEEYFSVKLTKGFKRSDDVSRWYDTATENMHCHTNHPEEKTRWNEWDCYMSRVNPMQLVGYTSMKIEIISINFTPFSACYCWRYEKSH